MDGRSGDVMCADGHVSDNGAMDTDGSEDSHADADGDRACPVTPTGVTGDVAQARRLTELLAAVADGDRRAFADFYDLTCSRVFGLSTRILRNPALAEEVTQEVYLQIWSGAGRYDPARSSPVGWLMTLTHRRTVDRVRAEQSASDRNTVYGYAQLGRDHDVVVEEVGQRLDEQAVVGCLDSLTATQREAIGLAYYGGRTYREVADQLDVALPTIKSRIRDGLIRLKNCLGVSTDA
ncbi:RNA polymerase sigma-70 factor, ECF subfamily [Rhodococcus tukisamuensis]|uniref:RNA polymerase sigma-70 factor, ECF subfamily n=2 Tax=Rhodococcus tukisamuensis TaxID=168276 RepID=A0A1G6SJ20_9NOCA|nr:ECF RNA polymerase sigma factor SigK [Rhodococcus tukisamuensis]SDD16828.1 RNA polymerase sigma-70 factor, ECF subfamily [Rhodococcus tukisamuensis]